MSSTTITSKTLKNIMNGNWLTILFIVFSVALAVYQKNTESGSPQIVFFDIGQGDAILIQEGNYQILVDGGPGDEIVYGLPKYMPWFDREIEVVILTHPHDDHLSGIVHVLEKYNVGKILYNPIDYENEMYEFLLSNYKEKLSVVTKGDTLQYGEILGEVMYPVANDGVLEENINNESVVLLFTLDNYKILLMGDAEEEVEELLLTEGDLQDVYILKPGHHCSKTSSSDMFLSYVNPDIAICSAGEGNKFGHPHYETIEKFESQNVQYLITYEEGDIVINF